tara:strand:- start:2473 stop:3324 length:852 start_codon:yes stop_codon:yes gene_type:complete
MRVTDKDYVLENKLVDKLELMITRMKGQDDNVITIDGDEGLGKTNLGCGICYYIAWRMGREYNVDHIFFDLDKLVKFASETKEQIIHWDEAALGGLSVQWWKANQTKFMQLLMVARKKKHFVVMCIPKFNYLREYFFVDRSIALLHVYARQNIHKGRFFYYTKRKKELLFEMWKRKRIRIYSKYRSFGGAFPEAMKFIFDQKEIDKYEMKKDYAILSLTQSDDVDKQKEEVEEWKIKYATLPNIGDKEKAEHLGVSTRTLYRWRKVGQEKMEARLKAIEKANI